MWPQGLSPCWILYGRQRYLCDCFKNAAATFKSYTSARKQKYKPKINPGLANQFKIMGMKHEDVGNLDPEDIDMDNLESDFMHADKMYDVHESEQRIKKKVLRQKIVERKYFKPPQQLNLLTWAEKEQIHYLQQLNSKEWTPERLAESFPASVTTIQKVLKSQWKPRSSSKIEKHDAAVKRNWELLTRGKCKLDENLKKHVMQFANRKKLVPSKENTDSKKLVVAPHSAETSSVGLATGEFGSIITNYMRKIKSGTASDSEEVVIPCNIELPPVKTETADPLSESYIVGSKRRQGPHLTLDSYKNKIAHQMESVQDLEERELLQSLHEKMSLKCGGEESQDLDNNEVNPDISRDLPQKYEDEVSFTLESPKDAESKDVYRYDTTFGYQKLYSQTKDIPMKITIPEEKWKEGGTYKVEDCFYNDSGEFLYRVPGLK